MKYLICIRTHGYAEVDAEDEAISKAAKLEVDEVEWSGAWGTSDCEVQGMEEE